MDLVREIDLPMTMDFMAISSYGSATKSSGVVRILKDLDHGIETLNYVEHYHNGYQEHQRKHKCAKKLANNIAVEYFHMECTRTLAFAASAKSLCSLLQ